MPHFALLTYYCVFILLASIAGGMIPVWFRLTHRGMQFAVSFVAGLMLGVGLLHMLPHAIADAALTDIATPGRAVTTTVWWMLGGFLTMFFIERFFCYHHHDVPGEDEDSHDHTACGHHHHDHEPHHDVTWSGAALGLFLHSALNGVALAASVANSHGGSGLAGLGTFLVIFLHKPFDAMTIGMLMARGGYSLTWRHTVNCLFSLAIPLGVLVFYFGLASADGTGSNSLIAAYALAFSAGTFLCIASSDLLPELQFHQHDRGKLSLSLLLGLAVAIAVAQLEEATHDAHNHTLPTTGSPTGHLTDPPVKLSRAAAVLRPAMRSGSHAYLTVASVVSVECVPARVRMEHEGGRWFAGACSAREDPRCRWPTAVRGTNSTWVAST